MIDSTFEGQRLLTIPEREYTYGYTIFEQHFLIGARFGIGNNFLIALAVGQADAGKVESIEKCCIAEGTGTEWCIGVKQIEHVVCCGTCLLNSRVPLSDHTGASGRGIRRFENIASRIDVGS